MIKGIIFDLDDVIVPTDHLHYLAWKKMCDENNILFNKEIHSHLMGVCRMDSLNYILKCANKYYSEQEKIKLANYKNEIYLSYIEKLTPNDLDPSVLETLKIIKAKGFKIAIGSSSKNAKLILKKLGIFDLFDAISDGTNITHSKPHPEVFLKAAKFVNLKPSECLVVGNAKSDTDAAIAGGFKSIGLSFAGKYEKTTYKIKEFKDILTLI